MTGGLRGDKSKLKAGSNPDVLFSFMAKDFAEMMVRYLILEAGKTRLKSSLSPDDWQPPQVHM